MKLIINADDAGIDTARNKGIFECIEAGAVTSISVIVYQPGWVDLLDRLSKQSKVDVGLHVNLTAGRPLIEGHKTLANERGFFFDKFELFRRAHDEKIDSKEVAQEFSAQFETLKKTGIEPSHVNGHNHVHILPSCREAFKEVIPEKMWVRLAFESGNQPCDSNGVDLKSIYDDNDKLISVFNFLSQEAKNLWGDKFRYTDDFGGTKITPNPTLAKFKEAVRGLKGEICELMCHPGAEADEEAGWFSKEPDRVKELEILTSEGFKKFLKTQGIQLISYGDLTP